MSATTIGSGMMRAILNGTATVRVPDASAGSIICVTADPVAAPDEGNGARYNVSNGRFFVWNNSTNHWDILIA